MREVAEKTTKLNCNIVWEFVFELNAAKRKIATNKIWKVLGCAADILPLLVSADKK